VTRLTENGGRLASSDRGERPYLWRFSRIERALHLMVIVSFFGLVMTGLPLHFSGAPWAAFLIRMHGGVHIAGIIHRTCAVITFFYFFTHIGILVRRIARSPNKMRFFWGPDSMVPQPKDVRDLLQMFRWFAGLGPQPRFDRFSYLEKFDYWAVFWGIAIIGGSGLLLWFPELFASFLPGWVFNVATIVHGEEALLALCFIFTIHFFNGQLRPQKFPLDLVIFTGRATTGYMLEEHPLEYERLRDEGRLPAMVARAPRRWVYVGAAVLGIVAMAIGLTLTGLVVWASLR
jgi:cytochrome b subunit of formate dehydrogenase